MAEQELPTNWGRWGDDDERGTLNLIDDAATSRAVAEVRTGRHVSLARTVTPVPFSAGLSPVGAPAIMPAAALQAINFTGVQPLAMTDTLVVNIHNAASTHMDAVAHIPFEQKVYPGIPLAESVTPIGVRHGSADVFGEGIVTVGVLLDLASDGGALAEDKRIEAPDLENALVRAGVELLAGDAVVVRAGWDTNQPLGQSVPGLDLSAISWLHEKDVSVYLGDVGDSRPPMMPMPLHQVALARLGMPLVDAVAVDELAEVCRSEQRWSFMLVLSPPRFTGTTGLPVNPIAIF